MGVTVGTTALYAAVRRGANIENQTAFITNAEILDYLNEFFSQLHEKKCDANVQDWVRSTTTVTVSSAANNFTLPSDLMKLISVDVDGKIARNYQEMERNRSNMWPWIWSWTAAPRWRLLGADTIRFEPALGVGQTYTLNYYPTYTTLNDGDNYTAINGEHRFAIAGAILRCMEKSNEPERVAIAQARFDREQDRINRFLLSRAKFSVEMPYDIYPRDPHDY